MRQRNKMQLTTIIRLVCIDRYSGFKYRRGSESRGGAGTGIGGKAEERSKRHEVESTHDYQSHGNRKGRTERISRDERKWNRGDKKITGSEGR